MQIDYESDTPHTMAFCYLCNQNMSGNEDKPSNGLTSYCHVDKNILKSCILIQKDLYIASEEANSCRLQLVSRGIPLCKLLQNHF